MNFNLRDQDNHKDIELVFGGSDPNRYIEPLTYVPIINPGHWEFQLDEYVCITMWCITSITKYILMLI